MCNETTPVQNPEYSAKIEEAEAKAALRIMFGVLSINQFGEAVLLFSPSPINGEIMTGINVANQSQYKK